MKRLAVTLLAFISFPSIANANLDLKIAEMCMKASDLKVALKACQVKEVIFYLLTLNWMRL